VDTLKRYQSFFLRPRNVYILFLIGINIISAQSVWADRINIFDIYRYAFPHLLNHQNLYLYYLSQYRDLFKYSPTFAVFFAPFSVLPYYFSYFLWNNLCMMIIPVAIYRLPLETEKKSIICWFVFIECLTCLQGTQANTIISALLVLSYAAFERKQLFWAALFIAIATYIKVFPIAGCALFLLYPGKGRFIGYFILCMIGLFLLPLCFITWDDLIWQYHNWQRILQEDHENRFGISIVGLVTKNFGITHFWKLAIQIGCIGIFMSQYIRYKLFPLLEYRLYFMASLLLCVVLVNHDAEDFSYCIAMIGVGIWYVLQPRQKWLAWSMLLFVIVVSVFPVDPTPKPVIHFMVAHILKALPCTLLWLFMVYQIQTKKDFKALPEAAV